MRGRRLVRCVACVSCRTRSGRASREKLSLIQPTMSDTPQQTNGDDCGVFMSMCADYLSEDLQVTSFAQADIPRLRLRMAHAILAGRLD